MRYRIEYRPNPNLIFLHVDQKLIHGSCLNFKTCEKTMGKDKFAEEAVNLDGLLNFCEVVNKLDGMESNIAFRRYQIVLVKASDLFSWDDILPHILCAMQVFVARQGIISEFGPPMRPSQHELNQLAKEMRAE